MEKAHQGIDQLHPHVLVIDDELDICCMVANYLKRIGCKVDMACNAADAYSMVEDGQYQAIVSDIKMPGEDGISLLVRIRKIRPDIPVILMADQSDVQLAHAAIKHGAFDSVLKPLDFILLEKIVERAVNHDRLLRLEKNYRAELEQTVIGKTLESEAAAAQLRVEVAGHLAAEEKLEQGRAAVEAVNTKLQAELAELKAAGSQLEQARCAAEAANEQLLAENAERQQVENRLQQAAAERTAELQTVIEQLLAELAERKEFEEKLKQARTAAEDANELLQAGLAAERSQAETVVKQLQSEHAEQLQMAGTLHQTAAERALELQAVVSQLQAQLVEHRDVEEQLEQTCITAEAANVQLRTELAERTAAAEQLELVRAATAATIDQLQTELAAERRHAEAAVALFQTEIVERQQLESSLRQTNTERTLELQTVVEQLQAQRAAERAYAEEQLEQARTAAEADKERLQAELAAERKAAQEKLEQAQAAADAAIEQLQDKHAERKKEWQTVTEQLQIEFTERQAAEELLKQARIATEAVNEQLHSEIAERQQLEISLQQAAVEHTLELQAVAERLRVELAAVRTQSEETLEQARVTADAAIKQMQAKHDERKQEWQNVTEQLQVEFTERQAAEEQLKLALAATEAVNGQLQSEIAGRQQLESRLQLTVAESTSALQSVIEQMEAERAAERHAFEEQLEQFRVAAEAANEQMQAKLAERKQEVQTVAEQLQIEFAERQGAEEQLEQARIAAEAVNTQLQDEIAERQQVENRLKETLHQSESLEQLLSERMEELESVSRQLQEETDRYLHAEKSLSESEYKHQSIIQADMDGFWLMGRAGHLLEVNNAYCLMSGYSEQELLAMHINDLDAADPAAEPSLHMQNLITDGTDHFEAQQRRKDGTVFTVEIRAQYPADEDGHIVVFLRDIIDQKRLEEAHRLCESLEQAGRAAEAVIEELTGEIAARKQAESGLEQAVAERTQEVARLTEQLQAERDGHHQTEETLEQARRAAEDAIEQLRAELAAERTERHQVELRLEQTATERTQEFESLVEQLKSELAERRQAESSLEQSVAERAQELASVTEQLVSVTTQLESERSERQQVESTLEQARLAAEAAIEQLQSERAAERTEAEEQREQARIAAAAAAEQYQAELAERKWAESTLEQTVAELTGELAQVNERLTAERDERSQTEERLEQLRLSAKSALEKMQSEITAEQIQLESVTGQLQAELTAREETEEKLEQARLAAAAAAEQYQAELAERRQAENCLEQAISERSQELERARGELQAERDERCRVEVRLETTAAEQTREFEALIDTLKEELAEHKRVESGLEQTVAERVQELATVTEKLQAERSERQLVESRMEQARRAAETVIEKLRMELDAVRKNAAEQQTEARLAAEAAIEQLQNELAECRQTESRLELTASGLTHERESLAEQLQSERAERQQVENAREQARIAAEAVIAEMQSGFAAERRERDAVNEQLQAECTGCNETIARLELALQSAETSAQQLEQEKLATEAVVEQLQRELDARRQELADTSEQLHSERSERINGEEKLERARQAAEADIEKLRGEVAAGQLQVEALDTSLKAEIAERQQVENSLEQRVTKLAAELVSSNELLQAERLEHERAEQALNKSEFKHRGIMQADMDGFWLIDRDGLLLEVNDAYCQMSGYSEQELLAMHVNDLETGNPTADITSFIQNVVTDSDDRFETQHRRKDGSVFDVEIRSRLTADEDGQRAVFLQDITARKQLEETVRSCKESCELLEQAVAQRTEELEKATELLQAEHGKRMQVKNILEQRIAERTEELEKTAGLLQAAEAERAAAGEELERGRAVTEAARKEVEAANQKLQAEQAALLRVKSSLERAKEFADLLFNSPLDTVHMFDVATGEMIRWNPRFTEVCGYSDAEIAQMKFPDAFYDEETPDSAKEALVRISAGKKGVAELTLLTKSGIRVPYEYGVTAIHTEDGRSLLVPVGRDITGRKTKSAILANMSREIRTETNSIINMNAFLLDTNLSKEQRHFAEIAYKGGESLLEYINDIVDFSNIEAGVLEIEKSDFDVKALLENTAEILAAKAADSGLELTCRIDSAVPAHLRGDPKRIREIIANIASNAIVFTRKGKIVISATIDSVHGDSVMLRISVKDTGSGKPDERQIALYDPAVLLEGSATRNYGDASLGLAMCKLLVDLMGGKIGVDSVEGKGTTFWFTAQLEKQAAGAVPQSVGTGKATEGAAPGAARPTMSDAAKKGIRILMAEDYLTNQQVAMIILNKLGYQADAVMNGLEAVAALESRNYDLVLMDCEMPKMNGFEATALIRSSSSKVFNHAVPIIALTANAFDQDRERCLDAGMNDYLTKPVRMEKLAMVLDKWLMPGAPLIQFALPLFEERELLEFLNGDVKYAKKVLNYVLKTFPEHVETLKELVNGSDLYAIGLQANTMTGLVSCTFTPALQEICAKVESAAQVGDLDSTRGLLPELEKIAVKTLEKIRTAATRV
ncbi:MAG TPA: PAS domain S-box protein [Desulfuromonadales bacterium]|nr:PAS domain S-box protein [Desulfuromonadales bacterium]